MTDKLTIPEVVIFTGKNESTIYRYIRKGLLKTCKITVNSRKITVVKKSELERVFNIPTRQMPGKYQSDASEMPETCQNNASPDIKELIKEAIQEQQSAIMKPIEQQALFLAGKYQAENYFLLQQVEILRNELDAIKTLPVEDTTPIKEENQRLKEQLAILPAEVGKVNEMLKLSSEKLIQVEDENQKISKILMQNADNIAVLQKQRDITNKQLNEKEQVLKKQTQEKEHLALELKKVQEQAEEMRQKLNKPWYKFW